MSKNIIFLDIDGVINLPLLSGSPAAPFEPGLAARMACQLNMPAVAQLSDLLCWQVSTRFDQQACAGIQQLCIDYDCEIVITSSWRLIHSLEQIQTVLAMAGLSHVTDCCAKGAVRRDVIGQYIREHQIQSYIVIDDMDLSKPFGFRFIHCPKGFGPEQYRKACSALLCQKK